MNILTPQEIIDCFINTKLEGDYNLLQDDLVKLGNAIAKKATQKATNERAEAVRNERAECVKFVRSLNYLVADSLEEKRGRI